MMVQMRRRIIIIPTKRNSKDFCEIFDSLGLIENGNIREDCHHEAESNDEISFKFGEAGKVEG